MARIFLANGAAITLSTVLVGYRTNGLNDFVSSKLLTALDVAKGNAGGSFNTNDILCLPNNFKGADGIINALRTLTGLEVTTDARALSQVLITRAEEAQARFNNRTARKPAAEARPSGNANGYGSKRRTGKTAKNGGRAASEARRRERSLRDRELRSKMKGNHNGRK